MNKQHHHNNSANKKKNVQPQGNTKYSYDAADENELKESKHGYCEAIGKVIKVEASSRYKVEVCIDSNVLLVDAYTSGHLRMNKIRIIQGDTVSILIPMTFDPDVGLKGRIVHRKDHRTNNSNN